MRTYLYLVLGLMVVIAGGCKEKRIRDKYAGPKKISRYQWIKMDSSSGEFTKVIYDIDTLGTLLLWDNNSDGYNMVSLFCSAAPASWAPAFTGVGASGEQVYWYSDYYENASFTFFSEPTGPDFTKRATYVLETKLGGKLILTAVYSSSSGTFKEVIELEPVSRKDL